MTEYDLPGDFNQTSGGLETLFVYLIGEVSSFAIWMLLGIFFIIVGAGYFSEYRRRGKANLPMWLTIGSFFTTIIMFVLFLSNGLINLRIVIIGISATLFFALMFFLSGLND